MKNRIPGILKKLQHYYELGNCGMNDYVFEAIADLKNIKD